MGGGVGGGVSALAKKPDVRMVGGTGAHTVTEVGVWPLELLSADRRQPTEEEEGEWDRNMNVCAC